MPANGKPIRNLALSHRAGAGFRRVTKMFGMDFFPDEGLMNHSLHTAIIDRHGKLVANIEANQFSADQPGDLVETVLRGKGSEVRSGLGWRVTRGRRRELGS